jgi:PP-loop superfamily ATP-utilizing enzyme
MSVEPISISYSNHPTGVAAGRKSENILWNMGMRQFRVHHRNTIARIGLGKKEMQTFWENNLKGKIVNQLKSLGYHYVTLGLQ